MLRKCHGSWPWRSPTISASVWNLPSRKEEQVAEEISGQRLSDKNVMNERRPRQICYQASFRGLNKWSMP